MSLNPFLTFPGVAHPLGPSFHENHVNFAVFSMHATAVSICLFPPGQAESLEIVLDPEMHKTGDIWHIAIRDLPHKTRYGYRVDGPFEPSLGMRFDPTTILLDPYATHLDAPTQWGERSPYLGIVMPEEPFDWEADHPPHIPLKDLIIYEMHVRGFTQDPSSQTTHPGTFLGVIEKIPHLKHLGINAVELMPLHEFREWDCPFSNPHTQQELCNYWGYATINFFAPMRRYGSIEEFRQMVKALHAAGIEVILDVVYNHTGEGELVDQAVCFRGLENKVYYMLAPDGRALNFSGCGNTLNANYPVVRALILSSLRYWVEQMHVDGFRFDLASIFTRDRDGSVLQEPPLLKEIAQDPVLAHTKLIAEAWDAGGLYQLGLFPRHGRWAEWNGKYRDSVRRFIKGTDGEIGAFATRFCGSEDLYGSWAPYHSINILTTHDGFTLRDLVSYHTKHNIENGEKNRDGDDRPESWNCGCEGETEHPKVLVLRQRQMRNFLLALFTSQGVPFFLMGDEYGHTKRGNNNTWAHDHRLNWFQWDGLKKNSHFFAFCRHLIQIRKRFSVLRRAHFLQHDDIHFHGVLPEQPDWGIHSRFLACTLPDSLEYYTLYLAFNAHFTAVDVQLPTPPYGPWHLLVDTTRARVPKTPTPLTMERRRFLPHSALLLVSALHVHWDQQ